MFYLPYYKFFFKKPILLLLFVFYLSVFHNGTSSLQAAIEPAEEDFFKTEVPFDPAWQRGSLENGLKYAIRHNTTPANQVSIRIHMDVGSMHERENEHGWAHFIEHMVFRGTKNHTALQMRETWQEFGIDFGSDVNAYTSATATVFQLDLAKPTSANLDTCVAILSEMVSSASFDPQAVDSERSVIFAEKNARVAAVEEQMSKRGRELFFSGLRLCQCDTIGNDETLYAATAETLSSFYRRWYRPERATVVIVGDLSEEAAKALIERHFSSWQGDKEAPEEPDLGEIEEPEWPADQFTLPGSSTVAVISWLKPCDDNKNQIKARLESFYKSIAIRIINKRLENHARKNSSFINASLQTQFIAPFADQISLSIVTKEEKWQDHLDEAFAILNAARSSPPTKSEVAREVFTMRNAYENNLQTAKSIPSHFLADEFISATTGSGLSLISHETNLQLFEGSLLNATTETIYENTQQLFSNANPRLFLISGKAIDRQKSDFVEALKRAESTEPSEAVIEEEPRLDFSQLPSVGGMGEETSREYIKPFDITVVGFANGSRLIFKPNHVQTGSIEVQLRFGKGMLGFASDSIEPFWMTQFLSFSGVAGLDSFETDLLLQGHKLSAYFSVEEEAFSLSGLTNASELQNQLHLLALKLTSPTWNHNQFNRFKEAMISNFDYSFTSAERRFFRELRAFLHPQDMRWRPHELYEIENGTFEQFGSFLPPLLDSRPVDVIIVGDTDVDTAIKAMLPTIAALPDPKEPIKQQTYSAPKPPVANATPLVFTHKGDRNQAIAMIGWSTIGGYQNINDRYILKIAASILNSRLFKRLRMEEGISYTPQAEHLSSNNFEDWGVLISYTALKPEYVDRFFEIITAIVSDMINNPVSEEELTQAVNPLETNSLKNAETNMSWVGKISMWLNHQEELGALLESQTPATTTEEIMRVMNERVQLDKSWKMVVLPD